MVQQIRFQQHQSEKRAAQSCLDISAAFRYDRKTYRKESDSTKRKGVFYGSGAFPVPAGLSAGERGVCGGHRQRVEVPLCHRAERRRPG